MILQVDEQLGWQHGPASLTSSIVSLACHYPAASSSAAGQATGQQGFWANIAGNQNLQAPVPLARWDVDRWYAPNLEPHRMYVPFGSFVDGVDKFDAGLFGLAAGEALALDPQARILLEQTQVQRLNSWIVILPDLPWIALLSHTTFMGEVAEGCCRSLDIKHFASHAKGASARILDMV